MIYSDIYLQKKRSVPTLFALLTIVALTFLISRLLLTPQTPARANPTILNSLRIANISAGQATVIFRTQEKEKSWIVYGRDKEKLDIIAQDARDFKDDKQASYTHFMNIKNLIPSTTYYFRIVSNNKIINSASGEAFNFSTIPIISDTTNLSPAYGKVSNKKEKSEENAIAILAIKDIHPLATITKSGGDFVIPLNQFFSSKTNTLRAISDEDVIEIQIVGEEGESIITTNLSNISPLPNTIILGEDYNFTSKENVLSATSQNSTPPTTQIGILYPKENAIIPSSNPLIKGNAYPGSEIKITIRGEQLSFASSVKTDAKGVWKLSFSDKLSPGDYVLIFSGRDLGGNLLQQTRRFSIAKSGESVLQAATPEASPTATSVPSPTVTPQNQTPSATPTLSPQLSPTPTPPSSGPTITQAPTVAPSPPATGSSTIPLAISSASLILLGIGILLFAF